MNIRLLGLSFLLSLFPLLVTGEDQTAREQAATFYDQGMSAYVDENWSEAETYLEKAWKTDGSWLEPLQALIYVNWKQKDYQSLVTLCQALADMGKADIRYLNLGLEAARQTGNREKAAAFEALIQAATPRTPDMLMNQAIDLINQGKNQEALPLLTEILEKDPTYGKAYYQLGMHYTMVGDQTAAVANFKKALQYIPESDSDYQIIQDLLAAYGQ